MKYMDGRKIFYKISEKLVINARKCIMKMKSRKRSVVANIVTEM